MFQSPAGVKGGIIVHFRATKQHKNIWLLDFLNFMEVITWSFKHLLQTFHVRCVYKQSSTSGLLVEAVIVKMFI